MGPRARDVLAAVTEADLSQRRLSLRQLARDRDRRRAGPGAARHLCRRARLGAARAGRGDRRRSIDALMEAGAAAWHRRCRLSRHRIAAAGEGLSRLGRRYRPRPHAARGRPRLGGEAEAEHALPRPRGAGGRRRQSRWPSASPASPSPIPRVVLLGRETIFRDGAAGRLAHQRRLGLHGRSRTSASAMSAGPRAWRPTG